MHNFKRVLVSRLHSRKFRKLVQRGLEGFTHSILGAGIALAVLWLGGSTVAAIGAICVVYAVKTAAELAMGSRDFADMIEDAVAALSGILFLESKAFLSMISALVLIVAFNSLHNE